MLQNKVLRIFIFACLMILIVFNLASCVGNDGNFYIESGSEVSLKKTASLSTITQAGEVVNYTYVITYLAAKPDLQKNAVPVSEMNISISDSPLDSPISCPKLVLANGESVTCTAKYTVTSADIVGGGVTDRAIVTGTFTSTDTQEGCAPFAKKVQTIHTATASASATVPVGIPSQSSP